MFNTLLEIKAISNFNYEAFTFFIGCMAMLAASVFFFFEVSNTEKKWRTSVLISGIITFIAAVHYYYMRDYNLAMHHINEAAGLKKGMDGYVPESPVFFRYVDWILTVPLMCVEFYLITKKAGAKIDLLWKLIFASVVMLITGYIGEAIYGSETQSWIWGLISGLAYFYIVYLVWFGEVAKLANDAGPAVARANKALAWFVLVGWAIYPIGYIAGTAGGLFGFQVLEGVSLDIVYNIGDAINKIGFGLVIYSLAQSDRTTATA
jgi:sensory rhodopsin